MIIWRSASQTPRWCKSIRTLMILPTVICFVALHLTWKPGPDSSKKIPVIHKSKRMSFCTQFKLYRCTLGRLRKHTDFYSAKVKCKVSEAKVNFFHIVWIKNYIWSNGHISVHGGVTRDRNVSSGDKPKAYLEETSVQWQSEVKTIPLPIGSIIVALRRWTGSK